MRRSGLGVIVRHFEWRSLATRPPERVVGGWLGTRLTINISDRFCAAKNYCCLFTLQRKNFSSAGNPVAISYASLTTASFIGWILAVLVPVAMPHAVNAVSVGAHEFSRATGQTTRCWGAKITFQIHCTDTCMDTVPLYTAHASLADHGPAWKSSLLENFVFQVQFLQNSVSSSLRLFVIYWKTSFLKKPSFSAFSERIKLEISTIHCWLKPIVAG